MKGFIEIQTVHGELILVQIKAISCIINHKGDSLIWLMGDNNELRVEQSYEEIKALIKKSMG